jgi:hypothetical protein
MSTQVGITTIPSGITIPAGATAQSIKETTTVGISKFPGVDGETKKASPLRSAKYDVVAEVKGAVNFAAVTSAVVGTPSTLKLISASQKQTSKERPDSTLTYAGHLAFVDGEGAASGAGAGGADEDTLGLVSSDLDLADNSDVSYKVEDKVADNPDGTPGYRQTHMREGEGTLSGKGGLDSGMGLGTDGGEIADFTGGVIICPTVERTQQAAEINTWSGKLNHFPVAVAA